MYLGLLDKDYREVVSNRYCLADTFFKVSPHRDDRYTFSLVNTTWINWPINCVGEQHIVYVAWFHEADDTRMAYWCPLKINTNPVKNFDTVVLQPGKLTMDIKLNQQVPA